MIIVKRSAGDHKKDGDHGRLTPASVCVGIEKWKIGKLRCCDADIRKMIDYNDPCADGTDKIKTFDTFFHDIPSLKRKIKNALLIIQSTLQKCNRWEAFCGYI